MTQSRRMSAIEAMCNVAVGLIAGLTTQVAVFSALGVAVTLDQNLVLTSVFTLVSLMRSYVLRRLFVHLGGRA